MRATSFLKRTDDHSGWTMEKLDLTSIRWGSSVAFNRTLWAPNKMSKKPASSTQSDERISIRKKCPQKVLVLNRKNEIAKMLTGSGENPLVRNQRTTAEKSVIDEESHLPFGEIILKHYQKHISHRNMQMNSIYHGRELGLASVPPTMRLLVVFSLPQKPGSV